MATEQLEDHGTDYLIIQLQCSINLLTYLIMEWWYQALKWMQTLSCGKESSQQNCVEVSTQQNHSNFSTSVSTLVRKCWMQRWYCLDQTLNNNRTEGGTQGMPTEHRAE